MSGAAKRGHSDSEDEDSSSCKGRVRVIIEGWRNKRLNLNVFPHSNTIEDMMIMLRKFKAVQVKGFSYQGKELERNLTAHECGIGEMTVIQTTPGGPPIGWKQGSDRDPKMKLTVVMVNVPVGLQQPAVFDLKKIHAGEILRVIKLMIQHKRRISPEQQTLTFEGKKLDDDYKNIGSYGIKNGSRIKLSLGPDCGPFKDGNEPVNKKQKK